MSYRTLVRGLYPYDEILGCGGTLLRRKAEGGVLGWLIVTGMDEQSGWSGERIRQRDEEIAKVAALAGFDKVFNLGLPTTKLDTISMRELITMFSAVFQSL